MPKTVLIPNANNRLPEFGTPSISQRLGYEMRIQELIKQLSKQAVNTAPAPGKDG
jgi:hypothetical protein